MSSIDATQSIANAYRSTVAASRPRTADVAATGGSADSSTVSISDAARAAAGNDPAQHTGYALPDYVKGWFSKDFPQDILDAAQARLDDIKVNGELGADGPQGLTLLPENQKLLAGFKQEMKAIHDAGFENASPEQSERFNLLLNLGMRLQLVGWQKPMNEADVQREFDIAIAMARLSAKDPAPTEPSADEAEQLAAKDDQAFADLRSGALPAIWRERWEKAGLSMPDEVKLSPGRNLWLDVANAAGIGDDELLSTLHHLAGNQQGSALTHALELFISERNVAKTAAEKLSGGYRQPADIFSSI